MNILELNDDFITDIAFSPVKNRFLFRPFVIELDGDRIECYYKFDSNNEITVVFFHGNGECALDYLKTYVKLLDDFSVNILVVEYRGYGNSTGKSNVENSILDSVRIFDALKLKGENTIVYGRSFGALPAIHLASNRQVKQLVLENGIYDVKNWLIRRLVDNGLHLVDIGRINKEIEFLLNNKLKLSKFYGETFVLHCRYDAAVPFEHAEMAFEDANSPKQIVEFKKGFHNLFFTPNEIELTDFFNRLLI